MYRELFEEGDYENYAEYSVLRMLAKEEYEAEVALKEYEAEVAREKYEKANKEGNME